MCHHWPQAIGGNHQQGFDHVCASIKSTSCCTFPYIGYTLYTCLTQTCIMVEWLCQSSDTENRDHKIAGMNICHQHISEYTNVHINRKYTGNTPTGCRPPKAKIIHNTGLLQIDGVEWSMRHPWLIRHELATIYGIAMCYLFYCRYIYCSHLHSNHMDVKKTILLDRTLLYWKKMNAVIKNIIHWCVSCLKYQQTQPQVKTIPYKVSCRPWELVGAEIFHFQNKAYLCTVDYCSKYPIVKNPQPYRWWPGLKLPRSHLQNFDSLTMLCSDSFAGRWTYSRP